MIRGSDLLDLPIYKYSINKKVSNIKSFLLNLYTQKVEALMVKKNLISNNIYFIPTFSVFRIYNDKILVNDGTEEKQNNKSNEDKQQYADYQQIVDKTILDFDNSIIGIIRDIWIDETNWKFIAFEVSEGYIDDFMTGRKIMYCNQKYKIMPDHVCTCENNAITSYDSFLIDYR